MLIFATGVYFTVRLGFLQFRHPFLLVKNTIVKAFQKKDEKDVEPGELTSFQAAMTSVSAIVGSGNIAGVATALVAGGPRCTALDDCSGYVWHDIQICGDYLGHQIP